MKTILYANTINYDFCLKQRPHHLMDILSRRGWKVFWVNLNQQYGMAKEKVNNNFELYHSWEVFKKRNPAVDVYFSSWSMRYHDLDEIDYKLCVYDSLDNFVENSGFETKMMDKANVLLTTSQPLFDLRSSEHNNIHMCRNACFPELGKQQYQFPSDMLKIKELGKPIILFSGALASWCDIELVEMVAEQYSMVVVGMPWGVSNMPKGIHYLGNKNYNELQAYYNHCDVNILPFKRCQVSDYSNPIKNYEAMSHGKITVAMDIPEAMLYPKAVMPSENRTEFMRNIKKALTLKDDQDIIQQCYKYADENSWYNRVDIIENAINQFCVKNGVKI